MADDPTVLDRWMRSLKNRPWIAALIVLAAVVTGVAGVTKGVNEIIGNFKAAPGPRQASAEDQRLQQDVVGSWVPTDPPSAPTGFVVHDFRFAYQHNGTFNWRGEYEYQAHKFPILVSGKWRLENRELTIEVTSSNIPLIVKEGFSNTSTIISVDADQLVYVDPEDRKRKVANRQK